MGGGAWLRRLLCMGLVMVASPARAQDPPPGGWSFKGEVTTVWSQGNAESFTLGLGATLQNKWGPNLFNVDAGAIRTESTLTDRRAEGTPQSYRIVVDENREKTAEAYFARSRYDRSVSERFFLFGGLDWLRNTFAGIDSRFLMALGAGNTWFDNDVSRFKTNYAATYTFQSDVVENPFVKTNFPGVRVGWEYWRQATSTTELESTLVSDLNLDETEDLRVDLTNSLTVAVSSALALKPSLQVLWRNLPALTEVELFSPAAEPLGTSVTTPLEKTDLLFRLALVVRL